MNPSKLLGPATLMMLAILSIATTTAATAATIPNVLPLGTSEKPINATTKTGSSTFGDGIFELTSPGGPGSQSGNGPTLGKLGLFLTVFEEIKNKIAGTSCTGLSNTVAGQVTVLGTFHIRDYKSGTELRTASILLLLPVHMSCGTILVVLSGCQAAALTPENTLTKTLTATYSKTGSDNNIITVLNEGNTGNELCQLLAKEGANATKLAAITGVTTISEFREGTTAVEVLVMPL